jgi:hypothetical protein
MQLALANPSLDESTRYAGGAKFVRRTAVGLKGKRREFKSGVV